MNPRSRGRVALLAIACTLIAAAPASAQSNGNLPDSALSPINTGLSCTQLANTAAAGWNTMALDAQKVLPVNGCDSAYRSYARQVYWRNYWCGQGLCGNAAVPGTSNHGVGLAVDVPSWVRAWIDGHGPPFGWCKCWSDAAHEPWHVKFGGPGFHRPDPGLRLKKPVLRIGSGGPGQRLWVERLQKRLRELGFRRVVADGEFGKQTRKAVHDFQKAEKIGVDGVVGPATWNHLRDAKAPEPKPPKPKPDGPKPVDNAPATGIDISMHQGAVDFNVVENAGYDFVIHKATEGEDYVDPTFTERRLDEIEQQDLVAGVYHFLRPRSDRPGTVEAEWFVKTIRAAGYEKGFLPPVIDIESTTLTPAGTCAYVLQFAKRVERELGVEPILYTYPAFALSQLANCTPLRELRLWIAHYGVSTPIVPKPWGSYTMWQWTSTGSVPGIGGSADLNRLPGGIVKLKKLQIGPNAGHANTDQDGDPGKPEHPNKAKQQGVPTSPSTTPPASLEAK